jgi:formylglycine-generating enzyme required for sulfatase activity
MKRTHFLLAIIIVAALLSLSLACNKSKETGGQTSERPTRSVNSTSPLMTVCGGETSPRRRVPPLKAYQFDTVKVDSSANMIERRKGQAQAYCEDIDGVGLEMVLIPPGTFQMGSPATEQEREDNEGPQHQVTVPQFYMGRYEVTQAQWRAVASLPKVKIALNPYPSKFTGDNLPIEQVSWDEAVEFCARLSKATGRDYRLPSESEWEYACRAGTTSPFAFGERISSQIVNYIFDTAVGGGVGEGTARHDPTAVGSFGVANAFGLYDMHGNVWEWCEDIWHGNYNGAPVDGSAWVSGGEQDTRVLRGGSRHNAEKECRSAYRAKEAPAPRLNYTDGFRVAASSRPS